MWLLLRLRRVNEYPVDRPWSHDYDHWWQRVYATIDELSLGTITPEVASAKFAAGTETAPSLHDEYCRVRGIILADSVLTSTERTAYAGMLRNLRRVATEAIKDGDYLRFFDQVLDLGSVAERGKVTGEVELDFLREWKAVTSAGEGLVLPIDHSGSSLRSADESISNVLSALPEYTRLRQFLHRPRRDRA